MYQKKLSKENLKQNYFPCLLCSFGPEICEAIPRTCHDVTGYNDMITNGVWLKYINWDTRVNYKYSLCLNGDMCVCVCYFSVHRQTLQIKSKLLQNNFMSEKKSRPLSPGCNDCDIWRNNHPTKKTGLWVPVYLFSKVSLHSTFIFPLGSYCWELLKVFYKVVEVF